MGGGGEEIFLFPKGGTENLVTFVEGEQFTFRNLNPIRGAPPPHGGKK